MRHPHFVSKLFNFIIIYMVIMKLPLNVCEDDENLLLGVLLAGSLQQYINIIIIILFFL